MISRQHTPLVLIEPNEPTRALSPLSLQLSKEAGGYNEAWLRDLIFRHPTAVPVDEIDPSFGPLIPVCTELNTRIAGPADAFFINSLGMPTLVECKLWRNPEARREVIGQILDYARVLRKWTYNDLQREAARALKVQGFDLAEHVRAHGFTELDEAAFVDNVTRNLATGRILLLILGDGIREGVEAIADYIQGTTGLHFTFGLVDTRVFDAGQGRMIVQPRVLAKTKIIERPIIIASGQQFVIDDAEIEPIESPEFRIRTLVQKGWAADFWSEVFAGLTLDDAEQRLPPPGEANPIIRLPTGNVWLQCYVRQARNEGGIYLNGKTNRSQVAAEMMERLNQDRATILGETGVPLALQDADGIGAAFTVRDLQDPVERVRMVEWFRGAINGFVNAVRPRVSQLADTEGQPA